MNVTAPPPPGVEIDDGVIEEARRRQRRRRLIGAAIAVLAAGVTGVVLAFAVLGSNSNGGGSLESRRLMFVHGRPYVDGRPFPLVVTTSLEAGNVGLCVSNPEQTQCGWPYPAPGEPLFGNHGIGADLIDPGRVGPHGEIDYVLAQASVAAVRVQGIGTLTPVTLPGLPPGIRAVAFYRPPKARGTFVPPSISPSGLGPALQPAITATALDRAGRVIPTNFTDPPIYLPSVYWVGATFPAAGRCALAQEHPGASLLKGNAATRLTADTAIAGPAFLTCLRATYVSHGAQFDAAVLLNAQSPGRAPAPLWAATTVPRRPGIVQTKPVDWRTPGVGGPFTPTSPVQMPAESRRLQGPYVRRVRALGVKFGLRRGVKEIAPGTVARRDGNAWLVVTYHDNLAQDANTFGQAIALLDALHITRVDLSTH